MPSPRRAPDPALVAGPPAVARGREAPSARKVGEDGHFLAGADNVVDGGEPEWPSCAHYHRRQLVYPSMTPGQLSLEGFAARAGRLHAKSRRNGLADPDRSCLTEAAHSGPEGDRYEQRQGRRPRAAERQDSTTSSEEVDEDTPDDPADEHERYENGDGKSRRTYRDHCDDQRGEAGRAQHGPPDARVVATGGQWRRHSPRRLLSSLSEGW